jgi:16S rRNA (uracil1498-N3)-methyltransferase
VSGYDFNAPRLYVDAELSAEGIIDVTREQSNYLSNVLRLEEGQDVLIFNGRHGEWRATLSGKRKHIQLILHEQTRPQSYLRPLHYYFAPLKHARLDYMVQKAVEMGVSLLQPVMTRRTQVSRVNLERMHANAIEAAEQCGLLSLPLIKETCSFNDMIAELSDDQLFIFCDEDAPVRSALDVLETHREHIEPLAVLIGPEGGFDPRERELLLARKNCIRISLGPRILRADTAAVAALALIQARLGDWTSL